MIRNIVLFFNISILLYLSFDFRIPYPALSFGFRIPYRALSFGFRIPSQALSFGFRIPYRALSCEITIILDRDKRIPMSFIFRIPNARIPMSFIFRIPMSFINRT
jgi:hypothetical protein